jgi:KaiC/GvpD/RAD55 family RecA-like ATPase
MTELRVTDIPYPGLAHVFSPSGLRLVAKSAGAPPTTSVLVRGAAGTGKTTLGLAIAHALAKASHGIAVYVATETSLADAIDKAAVLKLGNIPVVPYDATETLPEGAVALAHLVVARDEAPDADPSQLAKLVVDYAYELASTRKADAPVRAVVVDSFELPEGKGELLGRSGLAAFVQGLESLGISPVFVEEVGASTSERLTFVVDVVLQLALVSEQPNDALHRKLAVLKSRYSEAVPGPHDMALDDGVPTVWPDSASLDFGGPRTPVGFVVPQAAQPGAAPALLAINRGALVLSCYDTDLQRVYRGLLATPGTVSAFVRCGPHITVVGADGTREVPAAFGPSALAWALHRVLLSRKANAVIFHRLEHLLAQPRFVAALPDLIANLTRRGLLVCVHGTSHGLRSINEIADYTGPTGHFNNGDVRVPVARSYRAATAWVAQLPGLPAPAVKNTQEHDKLTEAMRVAKECLAANNLAGARDALNTDSGNADPAVLRQRVEMVLLLDRLGQSSVARTRLDGVKNQIAEDAGVRSAVAWAYAEIGAEWEAHLLAFEGVDQPAPPDAMLRLWNSVYLRYSTIAIHVKSADWAEPIQARFAAQALAGRGMLALADEVLGLAATRQGLSSSHLARLRADVRLESSEPAAWREADALYETLGAAEGLGLLERADITFNRGVIAERLADIAGAIERYRAARSQNPFLEAAEARLAALRAL